MSLKQTIAKILNSRDELSPRNFRASRWAIFLVFPLAVIIGDMRFYDLEIMKWGYESYELMLYPLGLGWLIIPFVSKRFLIPLLKYAAVLSVIVLPFQFLITGDTGRLAIFMAFQFVNGICAGCAFFLFCFELNNVERLYGMAIIQFYIGLYYTVWRTIPAVKEAGRTWVGAIFVVFFLVTVFLCSKQKKDELPDIPKDGKGSGAKFVIGLDVVFYIIMCMTNYIEWPDRGVLTFPLGIGSILSVVLILIIMLLFNRSALYIWLMFFALSLLGLGIIASEPNNVAQFSGSLIYGVGNGFGYIIIYYLCAGAIKRSQSFKMFRLYSFVFFIEYFFISGVFSKAFESFEGPSHYLALGVVVVLTSICLLLIPLMQKRLFETDWSDGFYLADMPEYTKTFAQAEKADSEGNLGLSPREKDVFALMLENMPLKTIALELGIAFHTVNTHYRSIYRKLGITSKGELFMKYGNQQQRPNGRG